jgi:D-alanine-D-alanine ligase
MAIRVGVLRGGLSEEREVSLKSGENVLDNLPEKYFGHDIVLTKNNEWLFDRKFSRPEKIFPRLDVVFNALHGYFGEDGKIQQLLEDFKIPYTGSGILASALGMNKILSRQLFLQAGLNVPKTIIIERKNDNAAKEIFKIMPPPWVIKKIIINNFNDLKNILDAQDDKEIIIEEYIEGHEASCGVIENFRSQKFYSLPVVEIIKGREFCPAGFSREIKKEIEKISVIAHRVLGCRHYSRQDFIVAKNKIYILEANTLPGLTAESLIPKALEAIGATYPQFLDHLLTLALTE